MLTLNISFRRIYKLQAKISGHAAVVYAKRITFECINVTRGVWLPIMCLISINIRQNIKLPKDHIGACFNPAVGRVAAGANHHQTTWHQHQ